MFARFGTTQPSRVPVVGLAWLAALVAAPIAETAAPDRPEDARARRIIDAAGVRGGMIVHLGSGAGKLTAALRVSDSYLVHGLDRRAENVDQARAYVLSRGLYGQVSIDQLRGPRLPYISGLVNMVVAEDLAGVPMDEVLRVLCPNGVASVKKAGQWTTTVKPRPATIDEWTHYLHDATNNAVAHDSVVGPPRHMQWIGSPKWSRHHDRLASMSALVSSGGRVFYILDEGPTASIVLPSKWTLIARDAFNGTILWKHPIPEWHTRLWPLKSGPAQLPRRLVATGAVVFTTLGIDVPVTALDAATGDVVRTYEQTKGTEELLVSDGVLFVVANPALDTEKYRDARAVRKPWWSGETVQIMAIRVASGDTLWQAESPVAPLTLTVDDKSVFFHDGTRAVCLDRTSGAPRWRSEPLPVVKPLMSFFAPTMLVQDGVLLFAGGEESGLVKSGGGATKADTLTALDADTGRPLWNADHPPSGYSSPEDLFVIDGAVWYGATSGGGLSGAVVGRDLRSGKVRASHKTPDVKTYWFHHRCHRGKATDRYMMVSRTGIEFIDPKTGHWDINHWVRGGCMYGIMPCNGLVYTPPHSCACYLESKQFGLNALAAAAARHIPAEVADEGRLVPGPAYGAIGNQQSAIGDPQDWPTYRHDAARSGRTSAAVGASMKQAWAAELGGKLSAPVIAGGKLFVASIDTHTVHALDAVSGKRAWSYTVGGRVDSPPTIHQGMALFGCADGWVYCLRAADGAVVWRFRAAPRDLRLTAFEQVESVWPVHGSVLVQDGVARFVAGRSMFLDGGLRMFALDAATGRKLSEIVLDDRDPSNKESLQQHVKVLNMPVALPDVLSSDGKYLYMRGQAFDMDGNRPTLAPHSGDPVGQGSQQGGETAHLFCPTGFLDGAWFHRSYWLFGRTFASGWNSYYISGKFTPAGRILVFDAERVYGFGRKPQYYRWTTPLEYQLFCTDREAPKVDVGALQKTARGMFIKIKNSKSLDPVGKALAVEAWVKPSRPAGVVLARGGPIHGYSLYLNKGLPHFAIRRDKQIYLVRAKQKVGNKWSHLTGVLSSDKKLLLYVNGELAASADAPGLLTSIPHQGTEIGADDGGPVSDYRSPFTFTGLIDEVRIYHGDLSAAEIKRHAAAAKSRDASQAKLAFACSFDKGDAADESGAGNHGEVVRVPFANGKVGQGLKLTGRRRRGTPHQLKYHWARNASAIARALVLAGDTLFVAAIPDLLDEEAALRSLDDPEVQKTMAEQTLALQGQKGGLLLAVSAADGRQLRQLPLDSPPVWDGMAAAGGRLYLATMAGKVVCFTGK